MMLDDNYKLIYLPLSYGVSILLPIQNIYCLLYLPFMKGFCVVVFWLGGGMGGHSCIGITLLAYLSVHVTEVFVWTISPELLNHLKKQSGMIVCCVFTCTHCLVCLVVSCQLSIGCHTDVI